MYNISHYHYVQNKGISKPVTRDQILWHNDLHKKKYEDIVDFNPADYFKIPGTIEIPLTTTYPGLLIGSGYAHPALFKPKENEEGDFQLGFFFDHTTGLPVIPGSSVKGVLKRVFPSEIINGLKPEQKIKLEKQNREKSVYISDLLKDKTEYSDLIKQNWQKVFFERKQVFHDAYITNVETNTRVKEENEVTENHLFADDYITPHTEGIFKDPNPIRFLKVAPGVTFTFQFKLKDLVLSDLKKLKEGESDRVIFNAMQIKNIFEQILLDFGIGAKRNIGYGIFTKSVV